MTAYRENFARAVAAAVSGALVLTANTRSARALRLAAEAAAQAAAEASPGAPRAWLSPEVMPFEAFIERLYSEALASGQLAHLALSHQQQLELWRHIIQHSPSGRQMLLPEAAASLAAEAFRTAHEYGIALDSPQMSASSDTRAFAGWAAEFRQQLKSHRWICSALFTQALAPRLTGLRLPASIFVYCDELTPAQRRFLEALAAAGVAVTFAEPLSVDLASPAQRCEFDGSSDELRAAAQWARERIEREPNARIGVLVFDLDRRLPQVESVFRAVLHPENLLGQRTPEAFEIASPLPLASYPVVRCALQLLRLFVSRLEFHEFRAMLASPYFNLGVSTDAVARFLASITERAHLEVSLDDLTRWLDDASELSALRSRIAALPARAVLASRRSMADWAALARQILQAFGWLGGVSLSSHEFQCTESWRQLLNSIASLEWLELRASSSSASSAESADFSAFVSHLERAAARQQFKPETRNAPLQVMDLAESVGSTFDALWIAAASDEFWPALPQPSPLLPSTLLRQAGVRLAGTPQAEAWILRSTARLLQSAPEVVASLARRTDDEREQRWSPLFMHLPLISAPALAPLPAEAIAPAALQSIADAQAPPIDSEERPRGGTALLEEQSACPFRAFAIRRLLARKERGPNDALDSTERGKIVEFALQLIWEHLQNSDALRALSAEQRSSLIATSVDQAMSAELAATTDAWTLRFRQLERQRTIALLEEWLAFEAARPPFRVVEHQRTIRGTLSGLSFVGRIDRIDEVDGTPIVLDYKTGRPDSVSSWSAPRPRRPQLPFYAVAMRQQESHVGGIAFAALRPGECAFRSYLRGKQMLPGRAPDRRAFGGADFDDYYSQWATELERLASDFVQGEAAVDPRIPPGLTHSPCELCHLAALCRVASSDVEDENEEAADE